MQYAHSMVTEEHWKSWSQLYCMWSYAASGLKNWRGTIIKLWEHKTGAYKTGA